MVQQFVIVHARSLLTIDRDRVSRSSSTCQCHESVRGSILKAKLNIDLLSRFTPHGMIFLRQQYKVASEKSFHWSD